MEEKELQLLNKVIEILHEKKYINTDETIYGNKVNINDVKEYIRYVILDNFSCDELKKLKSNIVINYDFYKAGVLIKSNNDIQLFIPDLDNIISAIVIIHELTHYITYINRLSNQNYITLSLYDELAPINAEFKFLSDFYKDYISNHFNQRYNEMIYCSKELMQNNKLPNNELINKLSHINSFLILTQNNDYNNNYELFKQIIFSDKPIDKEFRNKNIILKKSIINELKQKTNY